MSVPQERNAAKASGEMDEKSKVIPLHDGQGPTLEANRISDSTPLVTLTVGQAKELLRQVLREEQQGENTHVGENDPLLTSEEAASYLNVKPRWLYRHANGLPFTKRLSRRKLRFSKAGLLRWRAAKRA